MARRWSVDSANDVKTTTTTTETYICTFDEHFLCFEHGIGSSAIESNKGSVQTIPVYISDETKHKKILLNIARVWPKL